MQLLIFAAGKRIILFSVVVLLEVSFEPLAELKVVQVLGLNQLCNIDVALDSILVKGLLKHLVVLDVLVLVLSVPLDTREWESARIERVHHCTVDCTCSALLNLR